MKYPISNATFAAGGAAEPEHRLNTFRADVQALLISPHVILSIFPLMNVREA
jgi:hypothetical protein